MNQDIDATNSPCSIKSRIEKSITETPSSPLQIKTREAQALDEKEQMVLIQDSDIVISKERLKRQLNLLNDLDEPLIKEIQDIPTVPEIDVKHAEPNTSSRLARLLAELNSVSDDNDCCGD